MKRQQLTLLYSFTQDVCFHSTDSVQPPQSSLKEIIQNAGGEYFLMPELKAKFGRKLERLIPGQLVVISTPEDIAHGRCADFIKNGISKFCWKLHGVTSRQPPPPIETLL